MANFYLFPIPQWFKDSGVINNGGLIYTYAANTTTPLATYTDATGGTLNANPVVLDSAGRKQIWLSAASYKFVIQTSAGASIMTIDAYNPATINSTVSALINTGDLTLQQPTAATGGANQSSNNFKIQGRYWTGAADATDEWKWQVVLGAGANPTSTLTLTHSGSGGTVSINMPAIAVTFGNVSAPAFLDSVGNVASAGFVRMQSTDAIKWRNNANAADVALQKTGALAGGVPADTLDASGFGGVESPAFIGTTANPAQSGVVRAANAQVAVAARNAANGADLALLQADASNNAQITPPLRQVEQAAPTGIASSDLMWADSTDHRWKMKNNNGTAQLVSAGAPTFQAFTGNGTFTIPAGVTGAKVTLIGGGGAGGGATAGNGGGGGGAGGIAIKYLTGLTPANTIAVVVGAGGTGVSGAGGNGGAASTIASGTQVITTVTAQGGSGGSSGTVPQTGGAGAAVSTNGDINGYGAPGAPYIVSPAGAMGGTTMLGGNGNIAGGSSPGNAASANSGSGGSGAGAGASNAGGNGGSGIVIFEWVT